MTGWTPRYSAPGHIEWIVGGLSVVFAGAVLLIIGEVSCGGILMFVGTGWIMFWLLGMKRGRK